MPLVNCPECNHEVSSSAESCPNCAHPFSPPAVKSKVVTHTPPPNEGMPKWVLIALGALATVLIFVFIWAMQNDDSSDIAVNINAQRPDADGSNMTKVQQNDSSNEVVVLPSTDTTNDTQTIPPDTQTSVIEEESPDKGTVTIDAKVTDTAGKTGPVEKEKFYLLDKQLESILQEAGIKSINGQTIVNTFGLSVLDPAKYSEVNSKALEAIGTHIKYDTLSDQSGKAQMKGVKPGSYYLFAIHKTTNGFAVWSSPVTIKAGENPIALSPAKITTIK